MLRRAAIVLVALLFAGCGADPGPDLSMAPTLGPRVSDLIAALSDPDAAIRLEAAEALAVRGDETAVPALARAVRDDDYEIHLASLDALVAIGGEAAESALLELTDDPEWDDSIGRNRFEAVIVALGEIAAGDAAIERLLELDVSMDPAILGGPSLAADAALDALTQEAVPALVAALQHPDAEVRLEAIERLGALGGEEAVAALEDLLASKDADVRSAAIEALGDAGDRSVTAALVKALSKQDTRAEATRALISLYSDDATPLLKYLKAKGTVVVYRPLIRIGQEGTEGALVTALNKFGTKSMAEDYLNCGNATLEKAAKTWAKRHGYTVVTLPGGGSITWGQ